MVDRNGNGIDDRLEPKKKAGLKLPGQPEANSYGQFKLDPRTSAADPRRSGGGSFEAPQPSVSRQSGSAGLNGYGNIDGTSITGINSYPGVTGGAAVQRQGQGYAKTNMKKGGGREALSWLTSLFQVPGQLAQREQEGMAEEETAVKSLADYMREAMGLTGSAPGGGGIPLVNYDPQRETLRGNANENDARLEAMYRQLRGSIDADAPVIQKGYQEAIDSTAARSSEAQAQTQAATDAANSRNSEVLANLGIQEAAGNIVQKGTDLNTQTAQRMSDQAVRGQAAGDRLQENQQTAVAHNTNIGNAAGLEGNLQRASNQARLQALLADIDMQEQNQNQSIAAQNASQAASAAQSQMGQQLQLAQWLMGNDTDERRYQDSLEQSAIQAANEVAASGQQGLPGFADMIASLGITQEDLLANPKKYEPILKLGGKYDFGV